MMLKSIKMNKKPKVWLFPEAIERDYVDTLRGIVRRIESTVLKKLPQIEPHFNAAVRQDGFSDWFEQCMGELLQAVLLFVDDEKLASMVQVYTKQTADFNRKQFHKVLRSVYQVDIFTTEPWLEEALRMAEWENIQLIKSIPTQTLEKLRTRFMQAVRQGERWEDVVEDVKNVLNSSDKRAILIARDQVGKLNAHLTRLRQQHLGVKSYIWRGMLDERERAHHVEREGKQFDWDNPPDDGHPGEPILCRCYAEAVFPEFGELVEQNGVVVENNPSIKPIEKTEPVEEKILPKDLSSVINIGKSIADKYQDVIDKAIADGQPHEGIMEIMRREGVELGGKVKVRSLEKRAILEVTQAAERYPKNWVDIANSASDLIVREYKDRAFQYQVPNSWNIEKLKTARVKWGDLLPIKTPLQKGLIKNGDAV